GRLTEQARGRLAQQREDAVVDDRPEGGEPWSSWGDADERGPEPYPTWVVTELAAVDHELGVLKTGKEADVFLVERGLPGGDRACLLAAKRYRGGDPRLVQLRPGRRELAGLWRQLVDAMVVLARAGYTHGDLSAYNLLVHRGELVLIDLPQLVDVVANPQGRAFLERDVRTVAAWFGSHGLPADAADAGALVELLLAEAGLAGAARRRAAPGRAAHAA